ncbi:MAG: hypothetical protein GY851_13050, partial [bacterium]|nr:hypothetical protein [bacterium]
MNRFAEIAMPVLEWTIAFWWVYLVLLVGYGAFLIWFWEALRGEAPGREALLAKGIAPLLRQWERLRVLFNLMLIWEGVLLLSLTRMLEEASKHHEHTAHGLWFWGTALLCCVISNGF